MVRIQLKASGAGDDNFSPFFRALAGTYELALKTRALPWNEDIRGRGRGGRGEGRRNMDKVNAEV